MNDVLCAGASLDSYQPASSESLVALSDLQVGSEGRVFSVTQKSGFEECMIIKRFMRMGFLRGELVKIIQKAPLFQTPILVEVRGSRIALSADEARLVQIEVSRS